jgi:hypothetical protein
MQTGMSMSRLHGETAHRPSVVVDRAPRPDVPRADAELQRLLERVLGGEVLHLAPPALRSPDNAGETPVEGAKAVTRWVALHDCASEQRAGLRSGDVVGARQVARAVRSLFLYEHQLTAKTRRRARTILWQRDRRGPLPAFVERARWAACRCPRCQPALWTSLTAQPSALRLTA